MATIESPQTISGNQLSAEQAILAIIKKACALLVVEGKLLPESVETVTKAAHSLLLVAIRFALQANDENHQSVTQIKDSIYDEFDDLICGIPAALKALEMLPTLSEGNLTSDVLKDDMRFFLETFAAA